MVVGRISITVKTRYKSPETLHRPEKKRKYISIVRCLRLLLRKYYIDGIRPVKLVIVMHSSSLLRITLPFVHVERDIGLMKQSKMQELDEYSSGDFEKTTNLYT